MSVSSKTSNSDQTEDRTLMKIRPTRYIAWPLYFVMCLCYAVVALFLIVRPIATYVDLSGIGMAWLVDWKVAGLTIDAVIAIAFLFVAVSFFARAELKRAGIVYMVTENKIIRKDGLFSKADSLVERKAGISRRNWVPRSPNEAARADANAAVSEVRIYRTQVIPYTHIEKVDLVQNFSERILNIGTLKIDTGEEEVWFDDIPNAVKVQDVIMSRVGRQSSLKQGDVTLGLEDVRPRRDRH